MEKPVGRDLASARKLNTTAAKSFRENQIFRIDHYLAKETVQNILALRFANSIFEPIWNRNYIDSIQLTVAEKFGVGQRGRYFEEAGILRDIVQNHLMQLLALVAMEPPSDFAAELVRNEKFKIFQSIRPFVAEDTASEVVRGQYTSGEIDGEEVAPYRAEKNVSIGSTVETFAALRMFIDNWRWNGVPFFLRAGKSLAINCTEIVIQFRKVPLALFCQFDLCYEEPNVLYLHIQPKEGITLSIGAKKPGTKMLLKPVNLSFDYNEFGYKTAPAYDRLLLDALKATSPFCPQR